ncbi:UNVERIFIED_CONTAM: Galactinol--sucrose galactosyltransferase [Sesamum radiatum]|uniref:galactinol--sucrose galactosyltransferase n=1 Tax=Sesamum radiatum TaxID=300843 RepID=A0AAW2QIF9_SESRA
MAPSLSKKEVGFSYGLAQDGKLSSIILEGSQFLANGHPILTQVPTNIIATPSLFISKDLTNNVVGCFLGFDADEPRSRHVVPVGKLRGIRFMSIFRFKDFVQSGLDDDLDICVESGSTKVQCSKYRSCLYMHIGDDPYRLVKDAMQVIRVHLGTFKLLEEKCPPEMVDKFGWCTWDAFYLKVHPQGVWDGVKGLVEGRCPPGLVIIDDGWQSTCHDDDHITDQEGMNRTSAGEQMPCRLIKFEENHKFQNFSYPKIPSHKGMGAFVSDLKNKFKNVKHIYVWHALCGYWGAVRPNVPQMPECRVIRPKLSPGLGMTMEDLAVDKIINNSVGIVPPNKAQELFEGLHSHLKSAGIDGVKVDVIHSGACKSILTASVRKHFQGNGVIASMEHCNDFMFLGTEAIALGGVGDDFWCTDPLGDPNSTFWLQGCHMVHCAYNSLWMGNFIHPDWDMFQSTHPCAEFHAASSAISGGPIYVSDSVGKHDFELLKRLVLPDGTVLRCQHYALPTRYCLFEDPLHDGKTMLNIWNLNKWTGVLGAFNCQGGAWCPTARRKKSAPQFSVNVTCLVCPNDIEWTNYNAKNLKIPFKGIHLFAVYKYKQMKLSLLKASETLEITLPSFEYELFTVSP